MPMSTFGDCLLLWGASVVGPSSLLRVLPPDSLGNAVCGCFASPPLLLLCLDLLRNLLTSSEYHCAVGDVLALLQTNRDRCTQDRETEARFQSVLASIQVTNVDTNLCDIPRLVQLLPSDAALDALCLLSLRSKYKQRITESLRSVDLPEGALFSVVSLLRNLSLSSLDKSLIAPPSDYSESEKQQAQALLAATNQIETEEQSGISKQSLLTVSILTSALKAFQKSRKANSTALRKTWLELVFSLAEVKEARGMILSCDALTDIIASEKKEIAGHAAARLLLTTNPALVAMTQLQDAVPLVSQSLKCARHELVEFECALALVNLSGFHSDLRDQLVRLQVHRSALDLLTSENELIRRTGLELLCNLSASELLHSEIEQKRNGDLLQALCALAESAEEYTVFLAISALANIVHIDCVADVVSKKEALRRKIETLDCSSEEWRRRVAAITGTLHWGK